jgi:hypothetical protein
MTDDRGQTKHKPAGESRRTKVGKVRYIAPTLMFSRGDKVAACEANQEPTAHVELMINGEQIELNDFVRNFITHTVIGMVKSLRGVGQVQTISLDISRKAK